MVPGGGRDGAVPPVALVKAALWAVSLLCRAGGDRAAAGAGVWGARGCASSGAGGVDDLAGAAAERGDAGRQPGLPGDDGAVACGARRRVGRRRRSWRRTRRCGRMCRTGSPVRSSLLAGLRFLVQRCPGRDGGTGGGSTGAGEWPGARSRSPSGCGSTTRMTRRCASATRRSTRRSTSRAEGR